MGFTTASKGTLIRVLDDYKVVDWNSADCIEELLGNVAANSSKDPISRVEVYVIITTDPEIVNYKGKHQGIVPLTWVKNRGLYVKCPKCNKLSRPEEFYPMPDWVKMIEKMHKPKKKAKGQWVTKKINDRVEITQYERPKKHARERRSKQ